MLKLRFFSHSSWNKIKFVLATGYAVFALTLTHSNMALASSSCTQLFVDHEKAQADLAETYANYPELNENYQAALELLPAAMKDSGGNYKFSMADSPILTIVIPAFREAARIPASIQKMTEFFSAFPFPVEIMIRIEKSPDNTVEVAQQASFHDDQIYVFPHPIQRGKGYAVKQGMLEARGAFVLFMDADLSTPLPEIYKFLAIYAQNSRQNLGQKIDILIGDRRHPESQITAEQSLKRQVMGAIFRKITVTSLSLFGLKDICDTQCGFKMFTQDSARNIFEHLNTDGFAFDVEALIYGSLMGYSIKATPVQWIDDKATTVNPIIDPIKMLIDVGRIFYSVKKDLHEEKDPAPKPSH